mmetsp:Transcript_32732/g.52220  ORF Transcript_32732/g.52220 Transcript_32732/m.52220 type:complete len:399 (-) Transcript_32732:603-1799(-)|eukprot:CAMPEP_0203752524 /NCGR_PEP_ID=MMETSP0098-20131031/6434_1 /ASSEMBLY_ACC=CAM_ASM_000208 /TAXON_ID=96639 /ORGANISM=" , Strain NY0313808BC1" /LENGTH=398 /DNA_ID=CAMNT_0050642729 /DNA_START=292 /DNA_END=1488 /DNA_ORIENTATION=+
MRAICGDDTGLVKLIDFKKNKVYRCGGNTQAREHGIQQMAWVDPTDEDAGVLVATLSSQLRLVKLSEEAEIPTKSVCNLLKFDSGCAGLEVFDEQILACSKSGSLQILGFNREDSSFGKSIVKEFSVGKHVSKMRRSHISGLVATGGKENDLTLWDVATGKSSFKAKNVAHDKLDMRVPVWVTDMCFMGTDNKVKGPHKSLCGGTPEIVVTTTAYSQIRVYDTRVKRKPMTDIYVKTATDKRENNRAAETHHLNAIVALDANRVVVGDASGKVVQIDLRTGKEVGAYKGFSGSVRSICKHDSLPMIVSGGLGRYVRVHDSETFEPVKHMYVKQRLSSVLFSSRVSADSSESKEAEHGSGSEGDDDIVEDLTADEEDKDRDDSKVELHGRRDQKRRRRR